VAATGCAPHIHSGAENQLLVIAGNAFHVCGKLGHKLIDGVFFLISQRRLLFRGLSRGLNVSFGGC